jgi:hypothetical protein
MVKNKGIVFKIANAALILLAVLFILYTAIFWSFTNHAFIILAITLTIELNRLIIKGA